ncbi:MAG: hypothetical protein P8J50_19190 [Acidimicrobiales bacterium]|jgi:hypothetical protein|nr:hypothetical protein [Acidimicrobiales bacterium]
MSRRLEPTVFLAMISPITVGLVVGVAALTLIVSGSWIAAVAMGLGVWFGRVALSRAIAKRVSGLERRIDPFALREPWRFFVRDALSARQRFADALHDAEDGPLRTRLVEIEAQLTHAVEVTWDVALRGQQLTDARRRIDLVALERTLGSSPEGDPRHTAAQAQKDSHARLAQREDDTRERLEILDARMGETITRAGELATRTGGAIAIEELAGQVDGMVSELDSLRIALDEVGNDT